MEKKKRLLLQAGLASWVTPVVIGISLPAHAQTSACQRVDIIGEWSLAIQGSTVGAEIYTLTIDGGGMFRGDTLLWNTADNMLVISLASGSVIEMDLFDSCNTASGTIRETNGAVGNISGSLNGFIN